MFSPPAGPRLPEDRKLPITELKWDARTVTDIPGNNAYWFFAFFWDIHVLYLKMFVHVSAL
jgi:hypothetical protein